ncbi:DUF6518 family protein [Spirillospora sp. CA-255316]
MFATQLRESALSSPLRIAAIRAAVSLVAGLALGVVTNLAQGWLPGSWNQIANSGAVWSAVAFVVGALSANRGVSSAAAAGLTAEAGLVIGYYAFAEFGRDGMGAPAPALAWLVMAVVAGPLFGVAGAWWRRGRAHRRIVGGAALAGVIGAEGVHHAFALHYMAQAYTCVAFMVVLPLVMACSTRERSLTLLVAVPLALVAYAVVYWGLFGSALF